MVAVVRRHHHYHAYCTYCHANLCVCMCCVYVSDGGLLHCTYCHADLCVCVVFMCPMVGLLHCIHCTGLSGSAFWVSLVTMQMCSSAPAPMCIVCVMPSMHTCTVIYQLFVIYLRNEIHCVSCVLCQACIRAQ